MMESPSIGRGAPVLAFDVGGTDIKSALFGGDGRMLGLARSTTPVDRLADAPEESGWGSAPQIIELLGRLKDELTAAHPGVLPEAAAIVVPGIVDSENGIGVFASNLGWRDAPIRDLAEQRLGVSVALHHDIHSASTAELRVGGARAYENAVVVVLGTGIAGTVIIDGTAHLAGGFAGELGHAPVADGPECRCGARGCLETYASGGAIARRYRDRVRARGDQHETPDRVREIIALGEAGDADATAVWEEALDALALSFAQLAAVLAPEAIVLGGGLSRAGDRLFAPLTERLDARLSFHRRPAIVPAQLGENAGILGAALFARDLADHNRATEKHDEVLS